MVVVFFGFLFLFFAVLDAFPLFPFSIFHSFLFFPFGRSRMVRLGGGGRGIYRSEGERFRRGFVRPG